MENTISKNLLFNKLGATKSSYTMRTRSGKGYSPEQQVVRYENGSVFYSYGTLIAAYVGGRLCLSWYHDYSSTTNRYCIEFCGLTTKERRQGLESGEIVYIEQYIYTN